MKSMITGQRCRLELRGAGHTDPHTDARRRFFNGNDHDRINCELNCRLCRPPRPEQITNSDRGSFGRKEEYGGRTCCEHVRRVKNRMRCDKHYLRSGPHAVPQRMYQIHGQAGEHNRAHRPRNVTANSVARERRNQDRCKQQDHRWRCGITLWPTTLLLSHATNEALPVKRPPAQSNSNISPYGEEPTSRRVGRWSSYWSSMKRVHRTCGTKSCSVFPLSREVTKVQFTETWRAEFFEVPSRL